ncbi:unnamed protein product [Lupinus luteus]|uniref:Zinc finger LSD1-type domain-containing protein n=1 Tax=Lupinus luteus TaxID=3873 RepID=A0AAV1XTI4_LUPLU
MASSNSPPADIDNWLATQRQLVCSGCQSILFYPRGSPNVRCSLCNTVTSVPPPDLEISQLLCGGCSRMLLYVCGAATNLEKTDLRSEDIETFWIILDFSLVTCILSKVGSAISFICACNQLIYIDCGNCRTTLMFSNGASSVKCAICNHVTVVSMPNEMFLFPDVSPNGMTNSATDSSTSTSMPQSQNQTVIVENPMSVDPNGNLVSNVVLGVITGKK